MHIKTSDQPLLKLGFGNYTCNWGLHIAGLYETERERDEIIFGFLRQGYLDGDLQLYAPAERDQEDFLSRFSGYCQECAEGLNEPEYFNIKTPRELYYPREVFSPWDMDRNLDAFYKEARRHGQRQIRATTEMVWALHTIPGIEDLMAYESRLNYFIPGKPWVSICMYNIHKFTGATIMNVLRTHPFTISQGIITQNPYFMDPDDWLAGHAPQFLDRKRNEKHK